jgi:hypothetical protein
MRAICALSRLLSVPGKEG